MDRADVFSKIPLSTVGPYVYCRIVHVIGEESSVSLYVHLLFCGFKET